MNGLLVKTKKLKITKNSKQIAVDICLNKRNRKGDDVDDNDDHNLGKKKIVINSIRNTYILDIGAECNDVFHHRSKSPN